MQFFVWSIGLRVIQVKVLFLAAILENGGLRKMLNIWRLAPNGFGFSMQKSYRNHQKSLYIPQNNVQSPGAWTSLGLSQ